MNTNKYAFTREQLSELLYGTIGMFLEYRDVHDHTEQASVFDAVGEMFEGLDADRELFESGATPQLTLQLPVEEAP